jgi:hypothetical protein
VRKFLHDEGNQGRGLGMSTANQIITMAGGFLEVDSPPGEGTRIRLYLPLIAGNDADRVPLSARARARARETVVGRSVQRHANPTWLPGVRPTRPRLFNVRLWLAFE